MEAGESKKLESARLTQWHKDYSSHLYAFAYGLLRNHTLVEEAVQGTFAKALLSGGGVQEGSEKAWLFQVAYNEAMALRRRLGIHQRAVTKVESRLRTETNQQDSSRQNPMDQMLQQESAEEVRNALEQLSESHRKIVYQRIYEEKTFQQIADEFELPLGTVLTRMRTALQQLQKALKRHHDQ